MKKKFSLWLNIVTICLCVCAIMVGVYAATNATLTVSGQIGFEAHGCQGTVSGTIKGHALKNGENHQDGMPSETAEALDSGKVANFNESLALGDRYFSDLKEQDGTPSPIIITLSITNTSKVGT